jgi:hypothetical protein
LIEKSCKTDAAKEHLGVKNLNFCRGHSWICFGPRQAHDTRKEAERPAQDGPRTAWGAQEQALNKAQGHHERPRMGLYCSKIANTLPQNLKRIACEEIPTTCTNANRDRLLKFPWWLQKKKQIANARVYCDIARMHMHYLSGGLSDLVSPNTGLGQRVLFSIITTSRWSWNCRFHETHTGG